MDFWGKVVNVSEEAARQQINITRAFSPEKKAKIASDFLSYGIQGTRNWIANKNPYFSDLEITLEFVRSQYYETGQMSEDHWEFFRKIMEKKIQKDWTVRFKRMLEELHLGYGEVAAMGGFKVPPS